MSALDDTRKLAAEERAVAEAAPKGPWRRGGILRGDDCSLSFEHEVRAPHDNVTGECVLLSGNIYVEGHEAAATLAARSRTAVPALCDVVEGLLAVVDALPKCDGDGRLCGEIALWSNNTCDQHRLRADGWRGMPELPYAGAVRALLREDRS